MLGSGWGGWVPGSRGKVLGIALGCVVGVLAVAAASAAATTFTWTGAEPVGTPLWSHATNWGGTAPTGTDGTLAFPKLTSNPCITAPPTATCYTSNNDITGLNVNAITLDDGAGDNGSGYNITGKGITLGAGGLTASTAAGNLVSSIRVPLTLSAAQTWSFDDNPVLLYGAVDGGTNALAINTAANGELDILGDIEAGPVTLSGTVSLAGNRRNPEGQLNGVDGDQVNVDDTLLPAASAGGNSGIGPFTTSNGSVVFIGDEGGIAGELNVNGGATFDSSSTLSLAYGGAGTTPDTDYSQLSASGPVDLAGAHLQIYGSVPSGGGSACVSLNHGDVNTLVTTTGTLTGTFNGIPDGTVVPVSCSPAPGTAAMVRINYTPDSVIATVVSSTTTTPPPPPPPSALRTSAVQVTCYDTNPGQPGDFFQCTAAVGDASGQSPAMAPGGTVRFAVNPGGGGGFQGSSTCNLAPSQTGGASGFCSVNYVPPAAGIPIGSEPPLTATYSGSSVFASSSGQPQSLQAVEAPLCQAVYSPACAGVVPLPSDLADQCVSLTGCTPGVQSDKTEDVTISPDENDLVVKAGNPTLTTEEWNAYLSGNGGPELTARVQYILNGNTYSSSVNYERTSILQDLQDYLAKGMKLGGYSAVTYSAISVAYTDQINKLYDMVTTIGAQNPDTGLTFPDTWCNGTSNVADCKSTVALIQKTIDDSISMLATQKASLGVNVPYTPPPKTTKGLLSLTPSTQAEAARASKKRKPGLPTFVIAATKKVRIAPHAKRTIRIPIKASVRSELKKLLGKKRTRTLHGHLIEQITVNGNYTTRTIPVTIRLKAPKPPKKKRH